jgi:hypothetical protein
MAARFLLDTNMCIYIRQRRPIAVLARFRELQPGEAVLSVITYGELVYGAEKSQFQERASGHGAADACRRVLWVDPCQACSPRRHDRQQRFVDRRTRDGGEPDPRYQQRTRVPPHSRTENSELGGVSRQYAASSIHPDATTTDEPWVDKRWAEQRQRVALFWSSGILCARGAIAVTGFRARPSLAL